MKKSKQAYYDKYFERNWSSIKNTWKGIKSLIPLKSIASSLPTVLFHDNGETITNPYDIANTFNNYFASIAETIKTNKKNVHIQIFQIKVVIQYFRNLLIKQK